MNILEIGILIFSSFNTDFDLPQLYFLCCLKHVLKNYDWFSARKTLKQIMKTKVTKALEQTVMESPQIYLSGDLRDADFPTDKIILFSDCHSHDYIKFLEAFLFGGVCANIVNFFEECHVFSRYRVQFFSDNLKHLQTCKRYGWYRCFLARDLGAIQANEPYYERVEKCSKLQTTASKLRSLLEN